MVFVVASIIPAESVSPNSTTKLVDRSGQHPSTLDIELDLVSKPIAVIARKLSAMCMQDNNSIKRSKLNIERIHLILGLAASAGIEMQFHEHTNA